MEGLLQLAGQAGMNPEQAQTASSSLLNFVQSNMGEEKFNQQVLPNLDGAQEVMAQQQQSSSSSGGGGGGGGGGMGGLMGSAMSAFGGGGSGGSGGGSAGSIATLLASLAGQGVDPKMVQKFLPMFATYVKQQCGVDVGSMLGLGGGGSASATTGGGDGGMGGLPGNLGGLASSFGFGK